MVANHYRWDFIGLSTDTKPTPQTSEKVVDGSTYYCSDNSKLYVFYKDTWYEKTVSGGGGSTINVVQITGDSEEDVMSQKATTSMVFADPSDKHNIQIGVGATSSLESVAIGENAKMSSGINYGVLVGRNSAITKGNYGVAVGGGATCKNVGAVALGSFSTANNVGEFNIGSSQTAFGYNSSNYRLISGVYDGQGAHDAVTVGQINGLIDAINTAGSFNIPHIGA